MDIHSANQFCSKWLPAWTHNRPKQLSEFYSEDAFYLDPSKPLGIKGRENLLGYFSLLLAANPSWVWKASEVFPTGKGFTLKWEASIPVGREIFKEKGLDILEFDKAGLISRNEVFFDTYRWKLALKKG